MTEEIRLVASYKGIRKNLLWISLQDDGAVSIGFLGQPLVFDGFTSERELEDGVRESSSVDLRSTHSAAAMSDPHFTLHPPAYFHLRSGKNPSLIEGLVWTKPEHSALVSPWIRFISNAFPSTSILSISVRT